MRGRLRAFNLWSASGCFAAPGLEALPDLDLTDCVASSWGKADIDQSGHSHDDRASDASELAHSGHPGFDLGMGLIVSETLHNSQDFGLKHHKDIAWSMAIALLLFDLSADPRLYRLDIRNDPIQRLLWCDTDLDELECTCQQKQLPGRIVAGTAIRSSVTAIACTGWEVQALEMPDAA